MVSEGFWLFWGSNFWLKACEEAVVREPTSCSLMFKAVYALAAD